MKFTISFANGAKDKALRAQRAHTLREVQEGLRKLTAVKGGRYFGNEALLWAAAEIALEAAAAGEATDDHA